MPGEQHKPTAESRKNIKLLSGFGVLQKQIAAHFDISVDTLARHYRRELDSGIAVTVAKAAAKLYQKVEQGNMTAIIFFLKTRGGYSEKLDLSNEDGTLTPQITKRIFVSSREEVARLQSAINSKTAKPKSRSKPLLKEKPKRQALIKPKQSEPLH